MSDAKRPTYNHTRDDGPFNPCPECAPLQTPAERDALAVDRAALRVPVGPFTEVVSVELTDEDMAALREAVRLHHEKHAPRGILRAFCRYGYPSGPGTAACEALRKLTG